MTTLKLYYRAGGNHIHVRVFAGPEPTVLAHAGNLIFRTDEWQVFAVMLTKGQKEIRAGDTKLLIEPDTLDLSEP